ncbi:TRAP transporter substrate-binding protein [Candidatus Halobeggiatoa sp. HSG11]|nr:TRAP transporter substrate-binding protein [Candidatus Halobeggiatoa sp. HSG11]
MTKTSVILLIIISSLAFVLGYNLNNSNPSEPTDQPITANSAKTFNWKMVTTWPPNFPIFQEGIVQMAKDIETMSDGRLKIQVFAGGELVPALQTFDAVSQGTVEMGHGASYYWAGKIPEAQFMSSVPFGMTTKGMNSWLYFGGGLELWQEIYKPFNVIPFPAGNTGIQMGGWFNKKINSIDDLKGLKMRIPGLGGKVLAKAGGTPILLAGGEVYTALERGTIDATEWVGPFHDQRLGLNRAAKYYYYPGWHEPGTSFELVVNTEAWAKLPTYLQKIVETATYSVNQRIYSEMEVRNIEALQEIEDKTEILAFPPEVLNEFKRLTQIALDEESEKNPAFKKVYDAYSKFQRNNAAWSTISTDAYGKLIQ